MKVHELYNELYTLCSQGKADLEVCVLNPMLGKYVPFNKIEVTKEGVELQIKEPPKQKEKVIVPRQQDVFSPLPWKPHPIQ